MSKVTRTCPECNAPMPASRKVADEMHVEGCSHKPAMPGHTLPGREALMNEACRLFELVVERLGEYTGEWWTVAVEGGEIAVVRR